MYVPSPLAVYEYEAYLAALHEEADSRVHETAVQLGREQVEVVPETIGGFPRPELAERVLAPLEVTR